MQLLKLSSNNPKFKTIRFNKGLNIVAGLQRTKEKKDSINGIGKSLSLKLVHYILGAKLDSKQDRSLKKFLAEYGSFYLDFTHKDKHYTVEKNFLESYFYLNDEKLKESEYQKRLNQIFLPNNAPSVTFRQLLNCFARRFGESETYYAGPLTQQSRPIQDYRQNFANLFLLKVDTQLVEKKCKIKEKRTLLGSTSKSLKAYNIAPDKGNLKDLQDQINTLVKEKNNFIIALNYDKLKKQADDLTEKLNQKRGDTYSLEKELRRKIDILDNLKDIHVDIEQIEDIYNEAQFFFGEVINKKLNDAQQFHTNLVKNRKKRLENEIEAVKARIKILNIEKGNLAQERDNILSILSNKGALEERDTITEKIKALEIQKNNLESYQKLRSQVTKDKIELDTKNISIQSDAMLYIEQQQDKLGNTEDKFRELVKKFYDNHGGSLKLEVAKDAKYLFNIQIDIPKDGSQAVGEVKIFCYDVLLYQLNKDLLGFLAHDSCIFSEMDPRQKTMVFKVILELCEKNDLQYFLNISQQTLNDILKEENDILTEKEKHIINESIVLELYDKNPDNWLFGVGF